MKINLFKKDYLGMLIPFLLFCGLFSLGQFQRLEVGNLPAFYLHDLVLAIWAFWIMLVRKKELFKLISQINFRKYKVELILLTWIFLGWLGAWLSSSLDNRFIFYVIRFLVYSFVFFSIYKFTLIKKEFLKISYYLVGFGLLLIGFFQYLLIPDVRFLMIWGWDDHLNRLLGTQFDPNFMGILLVLLFINFYDFKFKKNFPCFKFVYYLLLFLLLTGISLTFSRATFLSFLGVLILRSGLKFKNYLWAILLGILIILSPKPSGEGVDLMRTSSIVARVESSKTALFNLNSYQYFLGKGLFANDQNNLVGVASNNFDHAYLSDNLILLIFNSTGVIGLSLFLFLGGKYLRQLYFKNKVGFLSVVAVMIHALFNNSFFQPFVFLYLIWGIVADGEVRVDKS